MNDSMVVTSEEKSFCDCEIARDWEHLDGKSMECSISIVLLFKLTLFPSDNKIFEFYVFQGRQKGYHQYIFRKKIRLELILGFLQGRDYIKFLFQNRVF